MDPFHRVALSSMRECPIMAVCQKNDYNLVLANWVKSPKATHLILLVIMTILVTYFSGII